MDDKLTHIILTDHALRYGLDGKSAYEIAQKYGYEGTEQEYAEGPVIAKDKANKAADSADKAAERAKKSASNADQQAARAKSLADHPPKIVDVGGLKYWAFWDDATKGYVTSEYRADDGTIVQQVDGSAISLDVRGRDDVRLRRTDLAEYCERRELDEAVNHPLHVGRYGYAVLLSGGLQHHGLDEARGEQELHHLHLVRCGQHDLR